MNRVTSWNPQDIIPIDYEEVICRMYPPASVGAELCGNASNTFNPDRADTKCHREKGHEGPCVNYYNSPHRGNNRPFNAWGEGLDTLIIAVRLIS